MAKVAPMQSSMAQGQHTSGIFADMTVDGPEIGTLVVIVDRAKNLPNRKSMGKQNPYCAARLGKEAKKTETDQRGGQTPRWDQELRFTVHDSLDYHNLKVSIFSEDKKTDLIGEAWVNLDDVITPGGGKNDMWQGLLFKGKYAGEIRIELTYYDSRPKPERKSIVAEEAMLKQTNSERVKRRPLPSGPNAPPSRLTPNTIPQVAVAGRTRHGPREFSTPPRANSLPPDALPSAAVQPQYYTPPPSSQQYSGSPQSFAAQSNHGDPGVAMPAYAGYEDNYADQQEMDDPYVQPDFLPSLPPTSSRQRPRAAQEPRYSGPQSVIPTHEAHYGVPLSTSPGYDARHPGVQSTPPATRPYHPPSLQHAHSDPVVLQQAPYDELDDRGLYTTAAEPPLHDLEYQHQYVQQHQQFRSDTTWQQPQYHEQHDQAPPLPPTHHRSMSALPSLPSPRSTTTPSSMRPVSRGQQQYVPTSSPLQSIERQRYGNRESPRQAYSPRELPHSDPNSPQPRSPAHEMSSRGSPGRPGSGYGDSTSHRGSVSRTPNYRHGAVDAYASPVSRQSPHPLSQEVRARSPAPEVYDSAAYQIAPVEQDGYHMELNKNSITPIVKPRAISPARGMEEPAQWQRKSTYSIQNPIRAFESSEENPLSKSRTHTSRSALRKSASPQPTPAQPTFSGSIPFGPDSFDVHNPAVRGKVEADTPYDHGYEEKRTITGWDGREIDPSDHLPVTSWAPEPEAKAQQKAYGQGRDRDFGPRSAAETGTRLSKDTTINVRQGGQATDAKPSNTIRARLVKKSAGSSPVTPLGEHANYNPIPDPYAQQDYSRGFVNGSPGISAGYKSTYDQAYPAGQYGAPDIPPKVPIYGQDALSRDIASIDIGSAPSSRTQAPVAYVPVRSHKDRHSFY